MIVFYLSIKINFDFLKNLWNGFLRNQLFIYYNHIRFGI